MRELSQAVGHITMVGGGGNGAPGAVTMGTAGLVLVIGAVAGTFPLPIAVLELSEFAAIGSGLPMLKG